MREPGLYSDYPSKMCSPYHCWFRDMGYPELDIIRYPDGEWAIIQYFNTPIIPSLTRWNFVLKGIRNTEITHEFCRSYAQQLDIEKHTVWDQQQRSERKAVEAALYDERRLEDKAKAYADVLSRCDPLMQRVARNGVRELDPRRMLNHISRSKLGKGYRERV